MFGESGSCLEGLHFCYNFCGFIILLSDCLIIDDERVHLVLAAYGV